MFVVVETLINYPNCVFGPFESADAAEEFANSDEAYSVHELESPEEA